MAKPFLENNDSALQVDILKTKFTLKDFKVLTSNTSTKLTITLECGSDLVFNPQVPQPTPADKKGYAAFNSNHVYSGEIGTAELNCKTITGNDNDVELRVTMQLNGIKVQHGDKNAVKRKNH